MFEKASRLQLRFNVAKGNVSVEDLWDLDVKILDSLFKTLNAEVKVTEEESLLATRTTANTTLSLKIDIVKYIVNARLVEAEVSKNSKATAERKQELLAALADTEKSELAGKSPAEIRAMIAAL